MAKIPLSLACTMTDRTEALLSGEVEPDGIELIRTIGFRPGEVFWRMLRYEEFDCSEMGLSVLFTLKKPWVGLPVFTSKHFFHTDTIVNSDSGIKEPADLEGKKVGMPSYGQTAAVWARGVLRDEYGVRPEKIHWYMGRSREKADTPIDRLKVEISFLGDTSLGEALVRGDLDALIVYSPTSSLVDVAAPDISNNPKVVPLFEDTVAEAVRYYKKTGIIPINHSVVLKKSVYDQYLWAATNIFKAFEESKKRGYTKWQDLQVWERFPSLLFLPSMLRAQQKIFGNDPFVNGLSANSKTLRTLARYMHEQDLTEDELDVDDLFAETLREY